MKRICFAIGCGLLAATMFLGCGEAQQPVAEEPTPANGTENAGDAGDGTDVALSDEEIQTLADTQKVCAVTGEELGSMGKPVPVSVTDTAGETQTVLLCCESCREELLSNPDEHLAKLKTSE